MLEFNLMGFSSSKSLGYFGLVFELYYLVVIYMHVSEKVRKYMCNIVKNMK